MKNSAITMFAPASVRWATTSPAVASKLESMET